ncbi:MAG: hypothetical protein JSW03_01760 [Candidatus Eiseniibacteriota bacterium]|nr:MAG: hypothetical protein JSW03_01760 [Candidatus Eisenbacteria bacterium]
MDVRKNISVTAICVKPVGTDLVAHSAFDALTRKMGFSDRLVSLCKEEVWLLGFALDGGEAARMTRMLAEETGVFVNPNRHLHELVVGNGILPHGRQRGRQELGIMVWSYQDSQVRPTEVAVRERLGVESLRTIRRLTLWWPGFVEGLKSGERCDASSSIVTTVSRKRGLLANPHYQGSLLLERALAPAQLLGSINEIEETTGAV